MLVSKHLLTDDVKFDEYFRLTPHLFSELLGQIEDDLATVPMHWVKDRLTRE